MSKRRRTDDSTRAVKRLRREIEQEEEEEQYNDLVLDTVLPDVKQAGTKRRRTTAKRKRGSVKRAPTLRQKLLKKLRADKKTTKARLTAIERDIRSLTGRKRRRIQS